MTISGTCCLHLPRCVLSKCWYPPTTLHRTTIWIGFPMMSTYISTNQFVSHYVYCCSLYTHTHTCKHLCTGCCSVSSGHSRAGGVQCNAGAVHAVRWRFPPRVCCHWQGELWWDVQVPPTDPSGEGSRWVPHALGRQQSWSGTPAIGECHELLESVFLHVYWVICWCQTVMTLVDNFLSLFCWHKQSSNKLFLCVICCIEFPQWRDNLETETCYHIICVWWYEKCMENCGWKLKERG